jgi:polynucleotide 5'-kinase involved in rRNA processing
MGNLEPGFYRVRGPASISLYTCSAEVMGYECSGDCKFTVPVGRTYSLKILEPCNYNVSPIDAVVENDPLGEHLYRLKNEIVDKACRQVFDGLVFIGPPDSFKSSLSTLVYNSLSKEEDPAFITVDIGQNEIFLPAFVSGTTISPLYPGNRPGVQYNCFTGVISPTMDTVKYLYCYMRIKNILELEKRKPIIVDTDGWMEGLSALYTKITIAQSFKKPLVVYTGLHHLEENVLNYWYQGSTLKYNLPMLPGSKSRSERRTHRQRIVMKAFNNPSRHVVSLGEVNIIGLPVFTGSPIDIRDLGFRGVIYAEMNKQGKLVVVTDNTSRIPRLKGIEKLSQGWEKGLIIALYFKGWITGVGLIDRIDYNKKRISFIANKNVKYDLIEVGKTRFPEVLDSLLMSISRG